MRHIFPPEVLHTTTYRIMVSFGFLGNVGLVGLVGKKRARKQEAAADVKMSRRKLNFITMRFLLYINSVCEWFCRSLSIHTFTERKCIIQ